ncbi:MAG: POTRA domain-containing protein [Chitinophagales bacterium]|nr:BamA/TamA family outer membrane protein [Bacteroidota bacterium]
MASSILFLKRLTYLVVLFMGISTVLSTFNKAQAQDVSFNGISEYEIGGIQIVGTQFLDENILVSLSGLKVGDKISIPGENIPNAMHALWKQGLFADVSIYASKIVGDVIFLEFNLKELPRLSKYKFSGTRKTESEDLRDEVHLIAGKVVNENVKQSAVQGIKKYFIDKGYLNVQVAVNEISDTTRKNNVTLDFNIKRGNKIKINEIIIDGNEHVYKTTLKSKLKDTKERAYFNPKAPVMILDDVLHHNMINTLATLSPGAVRNYLDDKYRFRLFSTSKFIEKSYKEDKKAMIEYYNSKGYRDAHILSDSVYFVNDRFINIAIDVEEGQRYYFRNIEWAGNSKYTSDYLSKVLGIHKGDLYDQTRLQNRLMIDPNGNDISSLYMDDGYLFFNVTPLEKSIVGDSIDLEIRMYEGPQATIDRVSVYGNDKTSENVIRRELYTRPGSKFSRADLIRSQRQLAQLGYFNPETIGIQPIPNPSTGTVDIDYTVEERPNDQLEMSFGWSGQTTSGSGVIGSIGVSFNNFSLKKLLTNGVVPLPSGGGQRLAFKLQSNGRYYQSINASFTEPWLGGKKPNSFTVGFFRNRQAQGFYSDNYFQASSIFLNTGAYVSLGRRLRWPDDNFVLINSVNYSKYNLDNFDTGFIVTNGVFHNFSLGLTLSRNSTDQMLFPRSGSDISLELDFTPPYSSFNDKNYSTLSDGEKYKWPEYHKWKVKAEWFTPISSKWVLRTSAKLGFIGYYNADLGYAPFERFEVGGDGLSNTFANIITGKDIIALRGYDVITENLIYREDGSLASVGDPFFNKFTLELRYPFSLNPNSTIFGTTFFEAGNSWSDFKEYNPFELRRTLGVGLRIFLPMFGLIGVDYGVGFDKALPENRHQSLGSYLGNYGKFSFILGFEPE